MSYKIFFGVIFMALLSGSCTWRHHVYKKAHKESHVNRHNAHAAKDASHNQKGGDASSTEKQKSKVHHKGGGTRFKFY